MTKANGTGSQTSTPQLHQASPVTKVYEIPDDLLPTRKALIVDDDVEFAAVLGELLQTEGWSITRAPDGKQGVQFVLASDFDVILCDMVMPGFPGDMFYRAVERVRPHLCNRFLFVTGHGADPQIGEFIRSVRGLLVSKPFQMRQLYAGISAVLGRQATPLSRAR